ncbi:MAG: hypothetical protein R3B40_22355 [Polyangiales bacterium]|nr:hypothetical protein [Myxococcales bacterium]MCB9656800.1 hypothetical protein [Sandaracinaceae bacterium]
MGALLSLAAAGSGCGASRTCGDGTVLRDGVCVASDALPVFSAITVSHLAVPYDTTQPVYLGHRLPIQLALRAESEAPLPEPREVAVSVALIEHFEGTPTVEERAALAQCEVATLHYELVGGGTDQTFEPILELPQECLREGRTSVDYDLMVFVDVDEEQPSMDVDAQRMFAFTEAAQAEGLNPPCRSSFEEGAEADGCLHTLRVEPSPGTDIEEEVTPDGNIALFWERAPGSDEEQRAMITVEIDRRAFGADPFDVVDPETGDVGDRNLLEGELIQRVRIAPAEGDFAGDFVDVEVDNENGDTLANPRWSRLTANSDNDYSFDLFPTEEILTLVDTGDWRTVEEFVIEVCLESTFQEAGELGGRAASDPTTSGSAVDENNCARFPVLGVRARPPAQAASELGASATLSRQIGNNDVGVQLNFESKSFVSGPGAYTRTQATADLASSRLPRIRVGDAKASAAVDLQDPAASNLDMYLDVFGTRVQSFHRSVPDSADLYSRDWNFTQRRCVSTRFQIGPVPLGIEGCVQGQVGLDFNLGIAHGDAVEGGRRFPDADAEAQIAATARPYINLGGSVSVAVDVVIFRAGVQGSLTVFDYALPVSGSLNVGFTLSDPTFGDTPSTQANLNLHVDQNMRGPNGGVYLFADLRTIRWCRAWIFYYPCGLNWSRIATVPLFKFGAARDSRVLYDNTTPTMVLN